MVPYKVSPWKEDDEFKSFDLPNWQQKKIEMLRAELLFAYGLVALLLGILIYKHFV